MRLHSFSYPGNVHNATETINSQKLAHLFHSAPVSTGSATVVIFRTESYPDYQFLCERMGIREPMSTAEYFS